MSNMIEPTAFTDVSHPVYQRIPSSIKELWLHALRCGLLRQTTGTFHNIDDNSVCAIGALFAACPTTSRELLHLLIGQSWDRIIQLNDEERASFKQIADWIEANL